MSRRNNRNKVNGVNSSKKNKGRNDFERVNIPIFIGILVAIICLLVVSIRSCTNLRGALTMMNPNMNMNMGPGQKSPGGSYNAQKGHVNMNMQNNVVKSGPVSYPEYVPATRVQHKNKNAPVQGRKKNPTCSRPRSGSCSVKNNLTSGNNNGVQVQIEGTRVQIEGTSTTKSAPKHFYYAFDTTSGAFHLKDEYTSYPHRPIKSKPSSTSFDSSFQSSFALSGKNLPSICKHGNSYGFSDLTTLRNAISELNTAYGNSVERYLQYKGAHAEYDRIIEELSSDLVDPPPPLPLYMKDLLAIVPDPFVICPFTHLKSTILGHNGPLLYINAEDIVIECDSCIIDVPATHFSFGPLAKGAMIRGVTLKGAKESSIIFRQDGADAVFEDCVFIQNHGVGSQGAVADLNSTR